MKQTEISPFSVYLMSQLLEDGTTLFDELAYDEMWEASDIHYGIFEASEWCKGEQSEYMEIWDYISNELSSVIKIN